MSKKIPLATATAAQLRAFAENSLGLDIPPSATAANMRAKIQQAWNGTEIPVFDEPGPDEGKDVRVRAPTPAEATGGGKDPNRKVRIMIQRTEEPGGDRPVEVGVNGIKILLPRGEPIEVAYKYVHVLENAIKDTFESAVDQNGRMAGLAPPRQVLAYPFSYVA